MLLQVSQPHSSDFTAALVEVKDAASLTFKQGFFFFCASTVVATVVQFYGERWNFWHVRT